MSRSDKAYFAKAPRFATVPAKHIGGTEGDVTPTKVIVVVSYKTNTRVLKADGTSALVPTACMLIETEKPEAPKSKMEKAAEKLAK